MSVILASASASRRAMLEAAGVTHVAAPAHVDEAGVKAALLAEGADARAIADALAELKALKVAAAHPDALVLGSDSIAVLADGRLLDKPESREMARAHLEVMSASRIELVSAAVIVECGAPVWRHVATAPLWVRPLSAAFIEAYLDAEWPAIAGCVGCFRIEGRGVQLFERLGGDQFTILGMPLLAVLGFLRTRGVVAS